MTAVIHNMSPELMSTDELRNHIQALERGLKLRNLHPHDSEHYIHYQPLRYARAVLAQRNMHLTIED